VRTRWEYSPGSDRYIVYSDGRNTATGHAPSLQTRSFAIKATRLLRFESFYRRLRPFPGHPWHSWGALRSRHRVRTFDRG
jgi:hypothetical protein